MTTSTGAKKPSPNRGAKILIASLSFAVTLSGWALITHAATESEATAEFVVEAAPQTLDTLSTVQIAPLPKSSLPNLSNLPVRGLREVGTTGTAVQTQPQAPVQQQQAPAPQQRNANNGGQSVVPPAPQPRQQEPKPKPQPVRKTKSSR